MNKTTNYNGYDLMMFPLEKLILEKYRNTLVSKAKGDVLELGAGTGINMSYYDNHHVRSLTLTDLDPDAVLIRKTEHYDYKKPITADITNLPFADNSFDTVVMTLVLCSVSDPIEALNEIKRVLNPNGKYIFIEHVVSCSTGLKNIQQAVTPAWKRISGNCHLERDSVQTIKEQGFVIDDLKQSAFCLIAGGVGRIK